MTLANAPSVGKDARTSAPDLPDGTSKIFLRIGLDSRPAEQPDGQISSPVVARFRPSCRPAADHRCVVAERWLSGSPDLLGLNTAGDGIEDGQPCLLDRRDSIIDRETRLPLESLGIVLSPSDIPLVLPLGNSGLQRVDVGGDFSLQC